MFDSINTSSSGLTAEKTRIDIISKNIANAEVTRAAGGMPYRRQMAVFQEKKSSPFSEFLNDLYCYKTLLYQVFILSL